MKYFVIPKATDANIILRMGSLSSAPYSTFHWYFKKLFILSLSLRGDTAFWITLKFYFMEAMGEHAIVFIYFPMEIVTPCIFRGLVIYTTEQCLWLSHFFPFCNLKKKSLPLLIKIGFDHIWEMQWWNKKKYQDLFHTGVELASAWWYLWGHWYLVTCCLPGV